MTTNRAAAISTRCIVLKVDQALEYEASFLAFLFVFINDIYFFPPSVKPTSWQRY